MPSNDLKINLSVNKIPCYWCCPTPMNKLIHIRDNADVFYTNLSCPGGSVFDAHINPELIE